MTDESEQEHDPISHNQLHEFHKDMVSDGTRVKKDATSVMQRQLQNISRELIQLAEEKKEERDGGYIEPEDVEDAFEEALQPYQLIDDFLTIMGEYEYQLKETASSTNVLDYALNDEE